ncbi:AMP-binding protein [Ideonella sp. A 288]|uniref:AMP-binding protein n=1 Tax=Ideonella sp. A 288 TaxID=1962181 RepID=UPI000B4BCA2E|nr:AMP-binding protein [Ideonella sp. A 288]
MAATAHVDTFARDRLPPPDQQPEYLFELPGLQFPERLNCASALLRAALARGWGSRACIVAPGGLRWTYADLQDRADRIAHVLVRELGLVPGNRVLLRAPNNPMMAACWFAVVQAGGIAVATMPLLRAKELGQVIAKAEVSHALCDLALADELAAAAAQHPVLRHVRHFNDAGPDGLEAAMARHDGPFTDVDTAADDTCLIAFTSGTTGQPKGTVHFHRDVMAICACWPPHMLRPVADDVFIGSPPLAFTFGLGGLLLFPMAVGASTVLLEKASPPALLDAIPAHGATVLFTAPTSYRVMAAEAGKRRLSAAHGGTLRKCVSAGEALPAATRALWALHTGLELIDGIGATELLHIFISADEDHARPGATGTVVPGYRACVLGEDGQPLPPGQIGRLAVKGPTGCRYLADARQAQYVQGGWNLTGDAYVQDEDGYFHYCSRTDDMIVSAGYNIAAPEVEEALLQHPAVAECAVIGLPDEERGQIVKAFVVLHAGHVGDEATTRALQEFVKQAIAPYKYPRAVSYLAHLPRTETGKVQRFKLKTAQEGTP